MKTENVPYNLYLGCEVEWIKYPEAPEDRQKALGKLVSVSLDDLAVVETKDHQFIRKLSEIKLRLRPLDDMTEEEAHECFHNVMGGSWGVTNPKYAIVNSGFFPSTSVPQMAAGVAYLLSKGFDLFSLIEKGLAIRKDKN